MQQLTINSQRFPCKIGKSGLILASDKLEGDMATPLGTYPLREVWHRPDRISKPETNLPVKEITLDDCWCDDPEHELYNQHFKRGDSQPKNFERLWREDHAYDLIVVIGYNDDPIILNKGSAIFMHCMHDDGRATAGCVALEKQDLLNCIKQLDLASRICISQKDITII